MTPIHWTIDRTDALTASDRADAHAQTVLVVADELDGVADVGERLIALGYRVQVAMAVPDGKAGVVRGMPEGTPDALMVCLDPLLPQAEALLGALKASIQNPLVPIIGYLAPHDERPDGFDSVLLRPAHPRQIAGRVDAMIRLQAMQHEIMRRCQVLRTHFGLDHTLTADALARPLRVLFIGKAKPEFMVVLNALRARNAEVVAAFTSFTAFDYLHGREFDAVIIDATAAGEPATSILSAMSRNVRLMHVPRVVLAGERPIGDALEALATDVIRADGDVSEMTGRILEPANYHRVHSQLRAEFEGLGDATTRDTDTGLWNADYLEAYLGFLRAEGEERTVCTVRLMPDAAFAVDEPFVRLAFAQAGGMVAGLVRVNDMVARLDDERFAVAVPPMRPDHLAGLCERITRVIECAAFESGRKGSGPFTLRVEVSVDPGVGARRVA